MYKFLVILLGLGLYFCFTLARPLSEQHQNSNSNSTSFSSTTTTTPATIVKEIHVNNPDGSYNISFETSNGIKVENIGYMKKILVPETETDDGETLAEHEELILVQKGLYSYMDPDGNIVELNYVADENGFQPKGQHLPMQSY